MSNCEGRDWAALEYDVVGSILKHMISLYDYLQFSIVCKSWYFVAQRFKRQQSIITSNVHQLPMLIVPFLQNEVHHSLYDLRTNNTRPIHFKFPFNRRCSGSSFGWLIMLENTLDVSLFNLFSGTHISLPPVDVDPDLPHLHASNGIVKAILTKDPSLYPNDYMVVAIVSSIFKLGFLKANSQTWIYQDLEDQNCFGDVNLCGDTLYAIAQDMVLTEIEIDGNLSISLKTITPELFLYFLYGSSNDSVYVVESSKKEVLLIKRFYSICREGGIEEPDEGEILCVKTIKFLVYKLTDKYDEDGNREVTEVKSLDGDAMFIGDNQSFCVSSKDFTKCLPNHIYYTDNCYTYLTPFIYGPQDAEIYNLEDESINTHYITDPAHRNLPPPIWIVPTICSKDFED